MPFRPGDTIHKIYRVLAKLNQGGFGTLYLGYDVAEERLVAIKESRAEEAAQQALQEEVRLLAAIEHANLPCIYNHFLSDQGRFCFVMEYIPGDNLENYFQHGHLPEIATAVGWIIQILEALSALHTRERQIIHHDVKLANIQVHGVTNRAYLLDLGVARSGPHTTIPPYSAPYAPPEQYEQRRTTTATDIYATGICLYILLTGVLPPESLARQRHETLDPPRQHNPRITPELEQVVMQALALDPGRRYPHAPAMLEALKAATEAQHECSRAISRQQEIAYLRALLAQRRRRLRQLLGRQRIYRRVLAQRRRRLRQLLGRQRIYRRLLAQRRRRLRQLLGRQRIYRRLLERRRTIITGANKNLRIGTIWTHQHVKTLGLSFMVVCTFLLLLMPKNVLFASLIVPLLGSYPLIVLGSVAALRVRMHGWCWQPSDSWLRLGGCCFYGMFIGLLALALIANQSTTSILRFLICAITLGSGVVAGVFFAGVRLANR